MNISRLPVFYKQGDNFFHPAWALTSKLDTKISIFLYWSCCMVMCCILHGRLCTNGWQDNGSYCTRHDHGNVTFSATHHEVPQCELLCQFAKGNASKSYSWEKTTVAVWSVSTTPSQVWVQLTTELSVLSTLIPFSQPLGPKFCERSTVDCWANWCVYYSSVWFLFIHHFTYISIILQRIHWRDILCTISNSQLQLC